MITKTLRLASLAILLAAAPLANAETLLIHAGQLLAVPGERPQSRQTIVVEGQSIVAVVDGFADDSAYGGDARIIDLSDQFVLPGLMDMHVHLQGELGPNNEKETLKISSQLMQMRSAHFAMKTLLAGFTTVRDVGSSGEEMFALRDAIKRGWIDGPRIIAAGSVGISVFLFVIQAQKTPRYFLAEIEMVAPLMNCNVIWIPLFGGHHHARSRSRSQHPPSRPRGRHRSGDLPWLTPPLPFCPPASRSFPRASGSSSRPGWKWPNRG